MCVRPLGDFPVAALIGRMGFEHALFLSAAIVVVATLGASFAARSPSELLPNPPNPPPEIGR
jgi:hypothetical protein